MRSSQLLPKDSPTSDTPWTTTRCLSSPWHKPSTRKDLDVDQTKASPSKDKTSQTEKKKTPTELKAELTDLQEAANLQKAKTRDLLMQIQSARDILKNNGTIGTSIQQDHYRLQQMVLNLRKVLDVKEEELVTSS